MIIPSNSVTRELLPSHQSSYLMTVPLHFLALSDRSNYTLLQLTRTRFVPQPSFYCIIIWPYYPGLYASTMMTYIDTLFLSCIVSRFGLKSFVNKETKRSQYWMRARVVAQGFTVLAVALGSNFIKPNHPKTYEEVMDRQVEKDKDDEWRRDDK